MEAGKRQPLIPETNQEFLKNSMEEEKED